ncbi:MAG TPA: DUF3105 domain-containing protein [Acidimicrobiales bacterium]|nr:DUF3105 domain-containing protein [Acidimicrobiales bacterium]
MGAGVVVVAIACSALAGCGGSGESDGGTAPTTLLPDMSEVQTYEGLSNLHVAGPVQYPQTPPVGGEHAPMWQNCGFYREPVAPENAVHSMEHGAVWITYSPDLAASQVDILRDLAADQTHVLVSPFPGLPTPVVASAWGAQLRLPSAGDRRLRTFVDRYRQSSQAPEPGAACTGAVGTPET